MTSKTPSTPATSLRGLCPARLVVVAALLSAVGGTSAGCGMQNVEVEHIKYQPEGDFFGLGRSVVTTFNNQYPLLGEGGYSPDVKRLSGGHVVVRGGGRLLLNLCRSPDVNTVSRNEFYKLGIITAPQAVSIQYDVEPVSNAIIPTDHDSLVMLTAYVNFDSVRHFYHDVLGDDSGATNTRATIVYYGELAVGCDPLGLGHGVSLPLSTVDNAAFVGTADVFVVLRDAVLFNGLELGTNPGVSAHEFGHRIWQHNVYADEAAFRLLVVELLGSEEQKNGLCTDDTPADGIADCIASTYLMKGMDEGSADILAFTYTGVPDFHFGRSLPVQQNSATGGETEFRDLSRDPEFEGEIKLYVDEVAELAEKGTLQFYRLGTLWSRGFFHGIVDPATGNPPATLEERVALARLRYAAAVIRAERRVGQDFTNPGGGLEHNTRFDPRQLIRRYIEEVSAPPGEAFNSNVHAGVCQAMCNRFGYTAYDRPLGNAGPQCSGFVGTNPLLAVFPCRL